MPTLKEVHDRIRTKKHEKKKLQDIVRDVHAQSKSLQEATDQLKDIRTKKLQLLTALHSQYVSEQEQIEKLALDIQTDTQLLSDIALTMIMKGETAEITDENDVKYESILKVVFKKAK